jgi:hypothetical protein
MVDLGEESGAHIGCFYARIARAPRRGDGCPESALKGSPFLGYDFGGS